jgi:hypothetical protein
VYGRGVVSSGINRILAADPSSPRPRDARLALPRLTRSGAVERPPGGGELPAFLLVFGLPMRARAEPEQIPPDTVAAITSGAAGSSPVLGHDPAGPQGCLRRRRRHT